MAFLWQRYRETSSYNARHKEVEIAIEMKQVVTNSTDIIWLRIVFVYPSFFDEMSLVTGGILRE